MTREELAESLEDQARLLRSTQFHTKLDRSLWEECADCWLWRQHSFCPNCGRPLTEEAWAELERRLGGR